MNPTQRRPWWLQKPILFLLVLLAGMSVVSFIAFLNSDTSTIVVYNETDGTLPPVLVRACGQTLTFPALADQASVRLALKPNGAESTIQLELATNPAWKWEGERIRPHGGQRVTIHLLPDRQVEAFDQVSWWRR